MSWFSPSIPLSGYPTFPLAFFPPELSNLQLVSHPRFNRQLPLFFIIVFFFKIQNSKKKKKLPKHCPTKLPFFYYKR